MEKVKFKKIIRTILIVILSLLTLSGAAVFLVYKGYGEFSIPRWARLKSSSSIPVEDYHSTLNYTEPKNSKIPRIDILMDDDYSLSKTNYTECSVQISNAAEYNLDPSDAKIRIRGNSTQYADKKPYKIKFNEKTSLFGGGDEKSWVLLANANDITGLHNYIAMEIYRQISAEDTFVPMVQIVNLYINNEYQGVYNLCDQIETGKTRVPISGKVKSTPEETDFLFENDAYAYYDKSSDQEGLAWFWFDRSISPFEIKSPDPDDDGYTREYTAYAQKRLGEIYDIILSKDWDAIQQAVDVDSFINGYLVSLITNNGDVAYKSLYYYLPSGGKLTYGPVWDMDLTFGAGSNSSEVIVYINTLWLKLTEVPEFNQRFKERYMEIYPGLGEFIETKIDEAVDYSGSDLENEFNIRASWGRIGEDEYQAAQTYDESISYMKTWTYKRLDYLKSLYNG